MGVPINPNVKLEFDSDADRAAVSGMGIDVNDAFVFAFAELSKESGCKQIKTAVIAKNEAEFNRLVPIAQTAGLQIPKPIIDHVQDPPRVFLEDCCMFSRDVQLIVLAAPYQASADAAPLQSIERPLQSLVIEDNDRNQDPAKRRMVRLRITPERITKDCTQL
jgi:hypothetical protein